MSVALRAPEPAGLSGLPVGLAAKLFQLRAVIGSLDGVLVAFSGGVDSTLLARVAHDIHGSRALACTAVSALMPVAEREEAVAIARAIGIRHRLVPSREVATAAFVANPPDRCYLCKRLRFRKLIGLARAEGLAAVVHGENADDANDYRPGARAAVEAGVRAPLVEAGIDKADVRALLRAFGLPNAGKAPSPCLATRIPYGQPITVEKLAQIERAEAAVRALGFDDLRVRHHGDVARVEVLAAQLERAAEPRTREAITTAVLDAGFRYATLDLQGFRSGSLNIGLAEGVAE